MAYNSPTITNDLLLRWHARHFPTASTPELMDIDHNEPAPAPTDQEMQEDHEEIAADHENFAPTVRGLGYYLNGVERTVTDEEFTLFRNSEIRQILEQRRKEREEQAERDWRETQDKLTDRLGDFQDIRLREARERSAREREACEREDRVEKAVERDLHRIERLELEADENHDPLGDAPMELGGDSDGEGESEELGHIFKKWSTTSARTKKKNKANRAKYRLKRKLAAMEASRVEKEEKERKAAEEAAQEAARKKRAEMAQWSVRGQATGLDAMEDNSRDLHDLY